MGECEKLSSRGDEKCGNRDNKTNTKANQAFLFWFNLNKKLWVLGR